MLRHCIPASIRKTLDQLPKSLDDTYLRVLRQIPQANQAHAHRMLQCLVVAVRPLDVAELAELLAFEFDGAQGGIPKYCPSLRLDDQTQAVLSTCSSLVTIINKRRPDRQVVQFSHFSVKEFLVSNRLAPSLGDISQYNIRLRSAHITLTEACLGLLLHSDDNIVEHSPLVDYAARHWVVHAQFEDVASCVKDGMETLFDVDKPHFKAWVEIYNIDPVVSWRHILTRPSPLYYSVLCGFYDLVEHLTITHPKYVNALGGQYRFPLLAAVIQGHVEVAELLLKHGAYIDAREPTGKTILLMAISQLKSNDNLSDVVEFLLTHGANVNARDKTFASSLHRAEEYYCTRQVVTILLKHGADVNSQDNDSKTPLHRLLENGIYNDNDSDRISLLLEHGGDVNRLDRHNQTPFLLAIKSGWFRTARILFEHGADANVENYQGMTPLHILSKSGIKHEGNVLDHVLLLLKHGAEVDKRDKRNRTPLHLAIRRNRFRLAGILLEQGADPIAENDEGQTPLHILSESVIDDEDNVHHVLDHALLLLKHGAEVNRRDKDKETPLHLAIRWDWLGLAEILLEYGADANLENDQGMTPLHILSQSETKHEDNVLTHVLLLLRHGADVDKRDKGDQTPLHLAIRRNRFKLAGILLEHGADPIAENNQGMTPLHILSESRIDDRNDVHPVLDHALLLLKHGAEVNRRDKDKETPLHLAIRWDLFKLVGILLENGADANAENDQGMTPLHILIPVKSGTEHEGNVLDHALLLLKHGADVNKRDKNNQTPLHIAIRRNRFRLAGILLEHGADANADSEHNKVIAPLHMLLESQFHREGYVLGHALLFIKHGAKVNRRDQDNETPLHRTIRRNWFTLADMLLEHGADPVAENNEGQTPLHILFQSNGDDVQNLVPLMVASHSSCGRVDIARVLLGRHGANASAKDALGQTPLHMVSRGAYISQEDGVGIAQLLLEHGADINAQDNNHATPLDIALHHGKLEIAELLLHYNDKDDAKVDQGLTPNRLQLEVANLHEEPAPCT